MKSCFGYIRVSTVKQGEGVSLQAQREAIEAFASQNNITISKWFEEKETAAKSGRPIFAAMIRAAKQGKADGIVLHKPDRAARNFRDWAAIGELSDAGIDVHFAAESLDFRSRGGRLSADIQAVIAADYIRNLREETLKGIEGRLKQGLFPFNAPIGYLDNGGGIPKTPDPERATLVREAFDLYASGQHSLRTLQAEMAKRGLRNRGRKPLSKRGIETMLANPFYCGLIKIRTTGRVYQGAHEPLISVTLFERVQEIRAGKSGKKVTRHNHTYRGLFRCGLCGAAMTPERQKGHVYYRCQVPDCPTKCVREEMIERSVHKLLDRVKLSDRDVSDLSAAAEMQFADQKPHDTIANIELQLANLNSHLGRLTDALIDQLIDKDTFNDRKQSLMLEQARLNEELDNQRQNKASPSRVRKFLELIKSLAQLYLSAASPQKRQITEWATSNRVIKEKNVYLEPANWLIAAEQALAVFTGDIRIH